MGKIRILVINDNRIFRNGIAALLNGQSDMHCPVMTGSVNDILFKASYSKPQIILVDLGHTDVNELALISSR